jgi:galactokinase
MIYTDNKINLFVPGRLCLFGEHSDWAGQMRKFNSGIVPGQALVACTEEGIYATARVNDKLMFKTVTPEGGTASFEHPFQSDELRRIASEGGFFSYIAGVAAYISTYYDIGGIELDVYRMTLPAKKGLSSSAAICVLTARAFNRLYGLNLTVRGEMEAAYYGEQLTPSRCGRLDQACAYGKGIMHVRFDGDNLTVNPVRIGAPLHFVFADLKGKKDTVAILRNLNAAYPYPQTDAHHDLHLLLGEINAGSASTAVLRFNSPRLAASSIHSSE